MKKSINKTTSRLAVAAVTLVFLAGAAFGQGGRIQAPPAQPANMGKGMGMITPGLMEIGVQTRLFLTIADRIKMTEAQKAQITDIAYQFQKTAGEKKADLAVAEAELQRMLSREQIDLTQVKAKLKEIQSLEADVEYVGIESLLKAIKVLTHEQHLLIMTLVTSPAPEQPKWQSQ
jgi:Spy/CpxP family protein refolding chaperone